MTRLRCIDPRYGYAVYRDIDHFRDMAKAEHGHAPDLQLNIDGSWTEMPTRRKPAGKVVLVPVKEGASRDNQ